LIPIVFAVSCALFLWYADWRADVDSRAQQQTLKQVEADILQKREARFAAAKKTEDTAKANATSYESSLAQTAVSSAEASSSVCDVTSPTSLRVVVNKKHCFNPVNWEPSDLVEVNGYYLRAEAASHMVSMMDAASTAGVPFMISSAYRSYNDQVSTYATWVSVNGSVAAADAVSARPGYSEHQTGLAADLKVNNSCVLECVGTRAQYTWLVAHAAEYGFVQRYPEGLTSITGYDTESWHWRYVGVTVAKDMKARGIQTLEAYFGVSGGNYAN
jgi:D-alanyl-D-alanine carboxypeptidase